MHFMYYCRLNNIHYFIPFYSYLWSMVLLLATFLKPALLPCYSRRVYLFPGIYSVVALQSSMRDIG